MRRVLRWRFYCEFCPKAGMSGGHMARHEASCTRNPNRVCRMCALVGESARPMPELIAALREGGVEAVRKASEVGCPVCILAAILCDRKERGVDLRKPAHGEDGYRRYQEEVERYADFDFKKERDAFFATVNDEKYENVAY